VRSALRSISLLAAGAVLYAAGVRRLHLHDFSTFVVLVLALSVAIVAVFVAARDGQER
jgi:hypothetical protein